MRQPPGKYPGAGKDKFRFGGEIMIALRAMQCFALRGDADCRVGCRLLAMTVVFDSLRTKTGACGIEEYVIARSAATWHVSRSEHPASNRPQGGS